jgi:hypothetical protein
MTGLVMGTTTHGPGLMAFPPSAPRSSPVVATAPDRTMPVRTDVQPRRADGAASDPVHVGTTLFCTALHSASRYEHHAPTERWREPRGSSIGTASH